MKILITGVSGQLAWIVAREFAELGKHELVGVDVRPLPSGRTFPGEFYSLRYTQRRMAEVFRRHKPDVLVHLGRIRGSQVSSTSYRYNQNVLGTRHLLELCVRHDVRRIVALSTFHVYGAHQHNHVGLREDEPLRASQIFPELADAVELDHAVTGHLWRYRRIGTVLLRPCNIIGPSLNNMISKLLRARRVPMLLGYDPMMQFVHERDLSRAIRLAVDSEHWGVFNIAGEGAVPYSHAIRLSGGKQVPVPHFLAYPMVGTLARWRLLFPKHLMDYFRYPTVIDDGLFRRQFGYTPNYTSLDALHSIGGRRPVEAT